MNRRPLEALARLLADQPREATIGDIANKYGETTGRILDAAAMLRLLRALGALDEAPITYIDLS